MSEPIQKSRRLKLSPKRHTGRRLHKSNTSYPLVGVLLVMVGVLLTAMTLQVKAADVVVTATANGPKPVQPAVILSPANGSQLTDSSTPVSGTCEPGYYIKLYRNEIFSGSALCTPGGTFSILTDLFVGRNDLQARTFNIADEEGPPSNIVTVYYKPQQPIDGGLDGSPFYLSTEYFFKAAYSGQKTTWEFDIFGGKGPFTAYVVWGDGYSDRLPASSDETFRIEHIYKTLKDMREYYTVTVRVVDSAGRSASLQLIAIMNDPNIISGALVRPNDPSPFAPGSLFSGLLKFIWSAYGIVLLMGICFWLGERRGESLAAAWYRRKLRRRKATTA